MMIKDMAPYISQPLDVHMSIIKSWFSNNNRLQHVILKPVDGTQSVQDEDELTSQSLSDVSPEENRPWESDSLRSMTSDLAYKLT